MTTAVKPNIFQPLRLTATGVELLDQRLLPEEERWLTLQTPAAMAKAIETMIVRGAPAIGVAAAFGLALSARNWLPRAESTIPTEFWTKFHADAAQIRASRPTAVNLMWAVDGMVTFVEAELAKAPTAAELLGAIEAEAQRIHEEDIAACLSIGEHGARALQSHLKPGATVMTHCNAGALATGGYGTALGVIRSLYAADPTLNVIANETRPRLQGAKLTAWELARDGIPVTVITDNMAASFMRAGQIQAMVVGADRIARNGDTANKIGTYSHALAAKAHNIPFYIAAPISTIDFSLLNGDGIPIEERSHDEIYEVYGSQYPAVVKFLNPGFDVTPAGLISGIITERGVIRPDELGLLG